ARILGLTEAIIPPASGTASALGFLAAPLSFEVARSVPMVLDATWAPHAAELALDDLAAEAAAHVIAAGVAPDDVVTERHADMRLVGQMHEIDVTLPAGQLDASAREALLAAFA